MSASPLSNGADRTVRYTNEAALLDHIYEHTMGDCLTVTDVSFEGLTEISMQTQLSDKIRFKDYDRTSQILNIVIPTRVQVYSWLGMEMRGQLRDMGLEDLWASLRKTAFPVVPEWKYSGGSMPERYERGCWPTLMVGAGPDEWWWSASGFSLDMARWLRNDMARWFYLSKHEVKIVLLLRKEAGDMFVMEKWEEDDANMPVCRQTITIFRDSETEPGSWDVVGGPLVLSFGLLFSRDPMPGSREGVFVVDEEALRKYADCVWQRCCAKTETELLCDQMEGLNTD